MSLDALLDTARNRPHRLVVYHRAEEPDVVDRLAAHGLDVERRSLPPAGPDGFLVVERNDAFVAAISLARVETLLRPPLVRPEVDAGVSPGYRAFFDALGETVFNALNRRQLLAVSREIEERAFRLGRGTLRASFQRLSAFRSQVEQYRALGETALEVHVYGAPDWTPPVVQGVAYHEDATGALDRHWALAYDGGGEPDQACGLVARERDGGYEGFWTNDAKVVASVDAVLAGVNETAAGGSTEADP